MAKTHSDLEQLFPLTGKPGLMLAQYVRHGGTGIDITTAGHHAGLSYATANRATAVLVDSGLVIANANGGYQFNLNAPHARIALDAVRVATSYEYRDEPRSWMETPGWEGSVGSLEVRDTVLQRHMPEPLIKRGNAVAGAAVVVRGPTALEARAFSLRIQRTVGSSLMLLVDTLQEPYALWHIEGDRDLIHQTLHIGAGVHAAINALTTHDNERDASARIEGVRWVHAAFALYAETTYIRELMGHLAHLADLLQLRDKIATQVSRAARDLERVQGDGEITGESRERIVNNYRDRLARAEARRDLVDQVIHNAHGRGERGFSAARLLFGTLEQYHRVIAPLAHDAFEAPTVGVWINKYRDAVRRGEQEPVEFWGDYPIPSDEPLPRHIRLKLDDVDAALDGHPHPSITPYLDSASRSSDRR